MDIFEKNRVELDCRLKNLTNYDTAKKMTVEYYQKSLKEANRFFRDSDKGKNLEVLVDWNEHINKVLGHDNISLIYNKTASLNQVQEQEKKELDYYNIGTIFLKKNRFSKALFFFKKELENMSKKSLSNTELCNLYINMGLAYKGLLINEKACECFQNAAKLGDSEAQKYLLNNCK